MFYPILLAVIVSLFGIYSLPEVKGWVGETVVKIVLSTLPAEEYIILNDIYIPAYDGIFTQIDHLVIATCGIIVIETKNYSGKLSGSSRKKYWIALRDGEIGKVYNPIRQNSYHIKMLRENCMGLADEKFYSIVCLSFGAKIEVETKIPITGPLGLKKIITSINRSPKTNAKKLLVVEQLIKEIEIERAYAAKEHKRRLADRRGRFKKGYCPRCNAKLYKRMGVKGEYLICSNYPVCKFRASNSV